MSANVGFATLQVIPSFRGAQAALASGINGPAAAAGTQAGGLFGGGFKKALGPIAAAVGGLAILNIGKQFDTAFDTIRVKTGATGKELAGLEKDFKKVFAGVPTDAALAGDAIAQINARLDLTGKPLRDRAKQILELSRITGTDLNQTIEDSTRLFGDWQIPTKAQGLALDTVFRASQNTGVGIDRLAQQAVQFGAPMRELGFSFDEVLALLGKFGKEGVNVELVMGGLRQGLGRMAKAGKDPRAELLALSDSIDATGLTAENKQKVFEVFGARAGIDMAKALEEGRFKLGDLVGAIANGSDTIVGAANDTADFGEKWQMLRNRVLVKVEPLLSGIFNGVGAAMDFLNTDAGKTILKMAAAAVGVLALVKAFGALKAGFMAVRLAMMSNPFTAIAVAIAALAVLVISNWDTIKGAFSDAWNWIKTGISDLIGWLKGNWDIVLTILTGPFGAVILVIRRFGDDILNFFKGLPGKLLDVLAGVGKAIVNAIISVINAGIQAVNDFIPNKIPIPFLPDIDLPDNPFPKIPKLHQGGTFFAENGSEGLALLRDGEVVTTPEDARSMHPMPGVTYAPTYNITGNGDDFLDEKMRATLEEHDRDMEMRLASL